MSSCKRRAYMNMDDEKLIELVQQFPILYDTTHANYMNNSLKVDVWKKIGLEMKVHSQVCKARWNNIRDNYRKSSQKNKYTFKRGQVIKTKRYKYYEKLSFLAAFIKGNDTDSEDNQNKWSEEEDDDKEDAKECGMTEFKQQELPYQLMLTKNRNSFLDSPKQKHLKPIEKIEIQEASEEAVMDYTSNMIGPEAASPAFAPSIYSTSVHPVDAFLAGVAPTLKSLNPYHLSLAKSEIFTVVHKYELKTIMQQSQYGAYECKEEIVNEVEHQSHLDDKHQDNDN